VTDAGRRHKHMTQADRALRSQARSASRTTSLVER